MEEFERFSGKGDSRGWRFNREEIHSQQADDNCQVAS